MTREISCKIYSIHDSPPEDLGSSFPAQIHESRASLYPGFGVSERVSGRCSPRRNLRARMATSTAEGEGGRQEAGAPTGKNRSWNLQLLGLYGGFPKSGFSCWGPEIMGSPLLMETTTSCDCWNAYRPKFSAIHWRTQCSMALILQVP